MLYMIFTIISLAILPDQIQVLVESLYRLIFLVVQLLLDSTEVHRVCNHIQVVIKPQRFPANRVLEVHTKSILPDLMEHFPHKLIVLIVSLSSCRFGQLHNTIIQNQTILIQRQMRRAEEVNQNIREFDKYQKNKNQPLNKKSYGQFAQNIKDKQLYELCRTLTHQNHMLRKENSQLKRFIENQEKDKIDRDSFTSQIETKKYREANYQAYKKKSMQLISSVKFLHKLYCERNSLKKEDEILDNFMSKLKKGNSNVVIELVRLFDQKIKEAESVQWNVDEIERQSSKYQNQLLRNHIKKMNRILLDCIYQLKRDVMQVREDMRINQQTIDQQIGYYCSKYINFPQRQYVQCPQGQSRSKIESVVQESKVKPVSHINKTKPKSNKNKVKNKIKDENTVPARMSAQKTNKPTAKPLQPRSIVPNIIQKLSQSLAQAKSLNNSIPLFSKIQTKPPKPYSQRKKQEKTIIDQLRSSTNTGKSAATPKSRVSASKSQLKDSEADYNFNFERTPVWAPHNTSGRKYYR